MIDPKKCPHAIDYTLTTEMALPTHKCTTFPRIYETHIAARQKLNEDHVSASAMSLSWHNRFRIDQFVAQFFNPEAIRAYGIEVTRVRLDKLRKQVKEWS